MKKKYYFRGMGLGILVTAILFSIGLIFYKPTMSDEEIKKRATELGMTEAGATSVVAADTSNDSNNDSADADSEAANTDSASDTADAADTSADTTDASSDAADTSTDAATTTTTENSDGSTTTVTDTNADDSANDAKVTTGSGSATADTSSASTSSGETGTITVKAGDDSMAVVQSLYKQGIIDNPTDFNKYLESNKYDRYIKNGTYSIKKGASYDEIVHTITSQ